jgi:lysophospholipase L1-like esterase
MHRNPLPTALVAALVMILSAAAAARAAEQTPFELIDGDRVVFIGGTFIEREQSYSYLETFLRMHWPQRKITFRNLGWSGDNVFGASRGYFEGADAGFARLTKISHELKPTVIFIGYGMAESFDGEAGLPSFRSGLEKQLDMLKDIGARETVLLGPIAHEDMGPPWPDAKQHNKWIRAYADAMKDIAAKRGHRFLDLYMVTGSLANNLFFTSNGIHLTRIGYWHCARKIEKGLGLEPTTTDLANGSEALADARLEKIRQLSIQKNVQYFNQWRPANETYIFGFRSYEQGKNAAEMPKFAKPIEELEAEISKRSTSRQ